MDPKDSKELLYVFVAFLIFLGLTSLINYLKTFKRVQMRPFDSVSVAIVHYPIAAKAMEMLLHQKGFDIIFQASNREQMIQGFAINQPPDIVLLSSSARVVEGVEAVKWLKQNHPGVKILVLCMVSDYELAEKMIDAGANGSVLWSAPPGELVEAIRTIIRTGVFRYYLTSRDRIEEAQAQDWAEKFLHKK